MFEQYVILSILFIISGILVNIVQKRPPEHTEELRVIWSILVTLMLLHYLRPSEDLSHLIFLNILMTLGLFLMISHAGFLIAMWRTRRQPYLSIPDVLPRMLYTGIGCLTFSVPWWWRVIP